MSGIEVPASIVGLIGSALAVTFQCVKGFVLLKTASSADPDIATVRLMISCEQREFEYWAETVGLLDEKPTLRVALKDLAYIQPILERLYTLLSDLRKIRSEFGLDLHSIVEESDLTDEKVVQSLSRKFQSHMKSVQVESQAEHGSRPMWQKLKWVVFDEARARKYVEALQHFVKQLKEYLDRAQRVILSERIELMYRTQIADSIDRSFLSWKIEQGGSRNFSVTNMDIGAAANLRQRALTLNLLPDSQSSNTFPETYPATSSSIDTRSNNASAEQSRLTTSKVTLPSLKISKSQLRVKDVIFGRDRQLGYLDSMLVLIEWRIVEHGEFRPMENRVNRTANFLKELTDNSFGSLPCVGYLVHAEQRRYGYILRVPVSDAIMKVQPHSVSNTKPAEIPVEVVSLREHIEASSSPSLDMRLRIAIMLLGTILQLHTSGWLHKALHPDNVLSFVGSGPVTRKSTLSIRQPLEFFLGGYTYARADEAIETTEPSLAQVYAQIYRHPRSLGQSRAPYRKSFDCFSIGCMLIEIGLWSTLESIFGNQSWPENCDFKRISSYDTAVRILTAKSKFFEALNTPNVDDEEYQLPRRVFERLKAAAGGAYANIVLTCLRATELEALRDGINETESILGLEQSALQQLRKIAETVGIQTEPDNWLSLCIRHELLAITS